MAKLHFSSFAGVGDKVLSLVVIIMPNLSHPRPPFAMAIFWHTRYFPYNFLVEYDIIKHLDYNLIFTKSRKCLNKSVS